MMNVNDIAKAERLLLKIRKDCGTLFKLIDSSQNITKPMKDYVLKKTASIVVIRCKKIKKI